MKAFIQAVLAKAAGFEWNKEGRIWGHKAVGTGSLGAAGAITLLGQLFGISAVVHSSGGLILTGSAGYISGTFFGAAVGFFAWFAVPLLVIVGVVALFWGRISKLAGLVSKKISGDPR